MRCDVDDVRTELIGIIGEEFALAGIENTVIQPTESDGGIVAPAQMMVPISADRFGRTPNIHVYFLPVLEDPPVVQFMVPLEYEVVSTHAADLARFVALVNSNLPLTGFEMNESTGMIVFRHTQALSTAPLDPGVIAWPLTMIRYAVETYGALIEVVAHGGQYDAAAIAFAAAMQELNESS